MLILTALKHMLYFYRAGGATAVLVLLLLNLQLSLVFLPQQQVDEHSDRQKGAPHGGVSTQEEEEVAEEAEEDHPDHMELKEQIQGVEAAGHGAQVFDEGGEACSTETGG